jgi:hypothetical protein
MTRACVALVVLALPLSARAVDSAEIDRYRAARAATMRGSLAPLLASPNPYERLVAIDRLAGEPARMTPALAALMAALAVDRTPVYSIQCMECQTEDVIMSSGCWGRYGDTDCRSQRELGVAARQAIAAMKAEPARAALAAALWQIALRTDAEAGLVAELMPNMHSAFQTRVAQALGTAQASAALRLLVHFPPAQCDGVELRPALERLMTGSPSLARTRAAAATLVCATDPSWREPVGRATVLVAEALADPRTTILGELPAVPPIVRALAGPIGTRMSSPAASDGREGTRVLGALAAEAAPALAGLDARLRVADEDEGSDLLLIAQRLGRRAGKLKPAAIACVRRNPYLATSAIDALRAMRVPLSHEERRTLKRAYVRTCRDEDYCPSFDSRLRP